MVRLSRSVLIYRAEEWEGDSGLQDWLRALTSERKRFGYRRLHFLLRWGPEFTCRTFDECASRRRMRPLLPWKTAVDDPTG